MALVDELVFERARRVVHEVIQPLHKEIRAGLLLAAKAGYSYFEIKVTKDLAFACEEFAKVNSSKKNKISVSFRSTSPEEVFANDPSFAVFKVMKSVREPNDRSDDKNEIIARFDF